MAQHRWYAERVAVDTVPDDLVAAVEQVLESHGWAGATAELIAEAAGLNRVTLYRRGLTKERLLAAAAVAAASEFQQATLVALTHPGTARERLEILLDTLYALADGHLALIAGLYDGPTAMFHLGIDPKHDAQAITRFEYTQPFERILRDGIHDRSLVSDSPDEDAELLFNTAAWTYVHLRRSHGWSAERARSAVTRISMGHLLPRGDSAGVRNKPAG